MAFLIERDIRLRAKQRAQREGLSVEKSLKQALKKRHDRYDIFLSQTIKDAEIVLGVYDLLTGMGYAVFCDWIAHPETNRAQVTPDNADFIRSIMSISDSLLFLDTENADQSKWMCWEIGWFDGRRGHVAVLPILKKKKESYRGREFLGLYPYVQIDETGTLHIIKPTVTSTSGVTMFEAPNSRSFNSWRNDSDNLMRPWVVNFGQYEY